MILNTAEILKEFPEDLVTNENGLNAAAIDDKFEEVSVRTIRWLEMAHALVYKHPVRH